MMRISLKCERDRKKCDCKLCKRGRRYFKIASALPPRQRKWMEGFYNYVMDVECEYEMLQAWDRGQKTGAQSRKHVLIH